MSRTTPPPQHQPCLRARASSTKTDLLPTHALTGGVYESQIPKAKTLLTSMPPGVWRQYRCAETIMQIEVGVGPWAPQAPLAYLGPVAIGKLFPKQTPDSSLQGLYAGMPGGRGGTEHICHHSLEESASGYSPSCILILMQPAWADVKSRAMTKPALSDAPARRAGTTGH